MAHYARNIHPSLASGIGHSWVSSSSSSPYATSSSSAHANLLLGGYMNRYPPGLGYGDWRGPGGGSSPAPGYYPRRRASIAIRGPTPARRPVPPRTQPASTSYTKFDPFSDDHSITDVVPLSYSPRLPVSSYSRSSPGMSASASALVHHPTPRMGSTRPASLQQMKAPLTIKLEPAPSPSPPVLDRNARSRLVAGILLNRVHAVGKPIRGARCREPREYVKSGLSSVVSLEA